MRVECPRCHGEWFRDIEPETGNPYACYRCGNTGTIEAPHGACQDCGEALDRLEAAGYSDPKEAYCSDCAPRHWATDEGEGPEIPTGRPKPAALQQ